MIDTVLNKCNGHFYIYWLDQGWNDFEPFHFQFMFFGILTYHSVLQNICLCKKTWIANEWSNIRQVSKKQHADKLHVDIGHNVTSGYEVHVTCKSQHIFSSQLYLISKKMVILYFNTLLMHKYVHVFEKISPMQ